MNESDLVVLRHGNNACYTQVVDYTSIKKDLRVMQRWPKNDLYSRLSVDLKNETWSWENEGVEGIKIGRGIRPRKLSYFIIGIYDRTKIAHLDQMNMDSTEAIRI